MPDKKESERALPFGAALAFQAMMPCGDTSTKSRRL
jgi:hypothetical protein